MSSDPSNESSPSFRELLTQPYINRWHWLAWILSISNGIGQAAAVGFDINRLFFHISILSVDTGVLGLLALMGFTGAWLPFIITGILLLSLHAPLFGQGFMYHKAVFKLIFKEYEVSNEGIPEKYWFLRGLARLFGYEVMITNSVIKGLAAFAGIFVGCQTILTLASILGASLIAPSLLVLLLGVAVISLYRKVSEYSKQSLFAGLGVFAAFVLLAAALLVTPHVSLIFSLGMASVIGISTGIAIWALPVQEFHKAWWQRFALGKKMDTNQSVKNGMLHDQKLLASFAAVTNALGQFASVWLPNAAIIGIAITLIAGLLGASISAGTITLAAAGIAVPIAGGTLAASGWVYGKKIFDKFGIKLRKDTEKLKKDKILNRYGKFVTGYLKYDSAFGKGLAAFMGMLKGLGEGLGILFSVIIGTSNAVAVYAKMGREAEDDFIDWVASSHSKLAKFFRAPYEKVSDSDSDDDNDEPDSGSSKEAGKKQFSNPTSASKTLRRRKVKPEEPKNDEEYIAPAEKKGNR